MTFIVESDVLSGEFVDAFFSMWDTAVGLPLDTGRAPNPSTGIGTPWIGGIVWIGGAWTGNVMISLPIIAARSIAAKMLDRDLLEVGNAEYRDTVKELANLSGGLLKSLLPLHPELALPGYFEYFHGFRETECFPNLITLNFRLGDTPLIAELRSLD